METVRLSMSQALIKFLDNQYVELDGHVYKFVKGVMGIFGHGNVNGIGEALENSSYHLKFIQGKNEQGMVHAATAFAKQKNRLQTFAVTSSIGPGAMNMITGASVATANRIPVLLLPGDVFADRQPDPALQQIENPADYTVVANDSFKPVSRYWDRIMRPEQLITAAQNAMRVLTDPVDTGAVTLCLPQDVQCETYDYPMEFFDKRIHHIERRTLATSAIERALELIQNKKKPLIIAGGGVHYSLATSELRSFAETFHIPVAETQAGKSALPWDHPLNVGAIGVTGAQSANHLAKDVDLVIAVGTRLGDYPTSSKWLFQNPDAEFLGINVSAFDANKMNATSVLADAKEALVSLEETLKEKDYTPAYEENEIQRLNESWHKEADRLRNDVRPEGLSQTHVLGEVNQLIGDHDVIVNAAGSLPGDLHRLWRTKYPKRYHMEYAFSCMGYEVSAAFGIKLAEPDHEVYALVGDGSYLMLHSELVTSLQEGKKINIVLFDNHGYQCIHNLQRGNGSRGFGNEFRFRANDTNRLTGDYMPIDFAAHAASLGAITYHASTVDEFKDSFKQARNDTVSTLIHVDVLPGTNSGDYESWWRVGVSEVSSNEDVEEVYENMESHRKQARNL